MRSLFSQVLVLVVAISLLCVPAHGRGGRGGFGGGHPGGGARGGGGFSGGRPGGGAMNHTPSFSAPRGNAGAMHRPGGAAGGAHAGMIPGGGSRPATAHRPTTGPAGSGGARPGGIGGGGLELGSGNRPGGGLAGGQGGVRPGAGGAGERWPGGGLAGGNGVRPGAGGAGERWPGGGPTGGNGLRPGGDRPNMWDRPGGNTRPGWENRPGLGLGDRPNINTGNIVNNRPINVNNANFNRPGYNRPIYGYHNDWYHGNWGWAARPAAWYAAGALTGAVTGWAWGPSETYVYSNPYYAAADASSAPVGLDYSQPIAVPSESAVAGDAPAPSPDTYAADSPPPAADDQGPQNDVPSAATKNFDSARASFKENNYDAALKSVDKAIAALPGDPVLHEFRSLVLFAQGKYDDAAAGAYAVLSAGPGWDWDTMKSLYPDAATYTAQLRSLEKYTREHGQDPAVVFLLAYHYMCLGDQSAAKKELERTVTLEPRDQLSAQLLKALQGESADRPAPAAEAAQQS